MMLPVNVLQSVFQRYKKILKDFIWKFKTPCINMIYKFTVRPLKLLD